MEKSFVFNSINGDRRYKAEDFREYFSSFIGNGVFPNPSTNLQVISNNNMSVTLKSGKGWINGAIYVNTDDYIISISPADGVLNRLDRIVLRMDTAERKIKAVVKKGQFSSSPSAIHLQRDADAYEIALADIRINKGAISITQADITDIRQNKELCGIVHGTVDQVDVTTLFNQYAAKLGLKEIEFEQEFKTWFETVKGQLSGDVAGNLANQIAENKEKIKNVETSLDDLKTDDTRLTKAKDITGSINELFTNANNGKQNWVDVIGSPLVNTDTFSTLKSKTQSLKNTLASNLTEKEQSSSGSESLQNLVNKVGNINTGGLKSIQRIIYSARTNKTINISPVDIKKSIILTNSADNDNAAIFENNHSITIKQESDKHTFDADKIFQIIEFNDVKSIQRGIQPLGKGQDTFNVPIQNIDMSKSLILCNNTSFFSNTPNTAFAEAFLVNNNTIQIKQKGVYNINESYSKDAYWQIVEFN